MSSLNRTEILGIYKKLLRTASKFPQYNYREFAQRRIYDYFVTNKAVRDTDQLVALRKEAEQALSLLQRQTYNFLEENFSNLKEYNDYLEHVEEIVFKLVNEIDVQQVEEEIREFRERNSEIIEKNRRRLNPDDQWIKEMLAEEAKAQARNQENFPNEVSAFVVIELMFQAFDDMQAKPRSIISELRDSDLPAEMILDRERKVQIEAELAEKEERERKKRERIVRKPREITNFGILRQSGKPYFHSPVVLPINGPILPDIDQLEELGYLNHVRRPSAHALAAGFRAELACYRALFEMRYWGQMVDLSRLYEAINALNGSNKNECEAASKFLDEFQKSVYAWDACDRLLNEATSFPACIFAAQTIRRKMIRDFRELHAELYLSLRQSIVTHMTVIETKFPTNFQSIATQLCVALADLYLQVPEWNDFIAELLNKFAELTQTDVRYAHILLELLKVFPEELTNSQLRIGDNRRNAVQKELAAQTPAVLTCLEMMCRTETSSLLPRAIQTFGSWMTNKMCPSDAVAKSQFYHSILMALQSSACPSDVHFAAATAVSQVLGFCENLQATRELAMMSKDALIDTAYAFEHAASTEDLNKLTSYGRVYADLCLMILEPLINTPGEGLGDLRYQLSESLYYLDENEFEHKRDVFKPFVERYVITLYKHCRFDADTERMTSENDEFLDFRAQVAESIKDIIDVMRLSEQRWEEIESGLFIIKSAANCIVNSDETVAPPLIDIVLQIPSTSNNIIMTTSIELIGELYDWLADRPEQIGNSMAFYLKFVFLARCMNWLLSIPLNVDLIKPWSHSLQKLTSKGYMHLRDYFERIHSVLRNIENCRGSFMDLEDAAEEILKAETCLLNDRPSSEISALLGVLLAQPLEYLDKICSGQLQESNNANESNKENVQSWQQFASDPLIWLDRITCIYRMLKPWQDQASYRQECEKVQHKNVPAAWFDHSVNVWRKLSEVFKHFLKSTRIMEHCCRTTRFVIRSMGTQSSVFIVQLAEQLVSIYAHCPHSCILYLSGIVVDEYGTNEELELGLVNMLNMLAPRALAVIHDANTARHNPETVDDLFRLSVKFLYRMPTAFFQQDVAEQIVQCAIFCVELDHSDANKSVVQFLTEVLSLSSSIRCSPSLKNTVQKVKMLISKYGQQLLWHCMHGSIFVLSCHLRYDVARLIRSLLQVDAAGHYGWLEACVGKLPCDSGLTATSQQLMEFVAKLKRCDRVNEVLLLVLFAVIFLTLKAKFNENADYSLALSLQDKEYTDHYDANRNSRRVSSRDHRLSREQQSIEDQNAMAAHRAQMDEISSADFELAQKLQEEFEAESRSTSQEEERDLIDLSPLSNNDENPTH
ncbi:CDK-activating kinase assembly factor MAT1 [Aphelenchoides besseyi]|nr:CDK-activating kinase assembly factor MAT1 [Aphelenchoides besseyi]